MGVKIIWPKNQAGRNFNYKSYYIDTDTMDIYIAKKKIYKEAIIIVGAVLMFHFNSQILLKSNAFLTYLFLVISFLGIPVLAYIYTLIRKKEKRVYILAELNNYDKEQMFQASLKSLKDYKTLGKIFNIIILFLILGYVSSPSLIGLFMYSLMLYFRFFLYFTKDEFEERQKFAEKMRDELTEKQKGENRKC